MGKTKTAQDYEADIREFHTAGEHDKAHHRASKWADLVTLKFQIANNEQIPYIGELKDLGYEVEGMPQKAELGFQQTGDYLCYLPDYERYTGVLWDRKSKNDAYGTLIGGRERFFRECDRACENSLFDYMLVGVECSREALMKYTPPGAKGCSKASMHGIIENLPPRFNYQVNFNWNGSRKHAINSLVKQNRMWLKYNYKEVLNLTDKEV